MIAITGSTGFVGSELTQQLLIRNQKIRCLGRKKLNSIKAVDFYQGVLDSLSDYSEFLKDVKTVVHCAARAHIMKDESEDPLNEYRETNTKGTLNLAEQAAKNGVKRFVFISSIKVNGEETSIKNPFTAEDLRDPKDFYGVSKSEAEVQLIKFATQTQMEVVVIRPPLVYGPGVKANFASLLNLVSKGLPLPFSCINNNKRSMVSVQNLVDLIIICIDHPKAANEIFLVSDDVDLSTSEMIKKLMKACGKNDFMFPIPLFLFKLIGRLLGKTEIIGRLTGSLHVDISKTKDLLSWIPPMSVDECFKKTADDFFKNKRIK